MTLLGTGRQGSGCREEVTMSRIPGTALHDDDPPQPTIERATRTIESLRQQLRFYESVMAHQGPHHQRDRTCKLAEANGLSCCNPACNGQWGTGCWCCHALSFAQDAETAQMVAHLSLAPVKARAKDEESEAFKRQASVALAAIEGLLRKFPETEIELCGTKWKIVDLPREIVKRTEVGKEIIRAPWLLLRGWP
jgi:hypothetical protein